MSSPILAKIYGSVSAGMGPFHSRLCRWQGRPGKCGGGLPGSTPSGVAGGSEARLLLLQEAQQGLVEAAVPTLDGRVFPQTREEGIKLSCGADVMEEVDPVGELLR